MTVVWSGLIIGIAALIAVALSVLDHQRRSFLAQRSQRHSRGGHSRAGDRTHRVPSVSTVAPSSGIATLRFGVLRDRLSRSMARRGDPRPRKARRNTSRSSARRPTQRKHAAHSILRAMQANGRKAAPIELPSAEPTQTIARPAIQSEIVATTAAAALSSVPPPHAHLAGRPSPSNGAAQEVVPEAAEWVPATAGQGIVRVDADGSMRFPDPVAREILEWHAGDLSLSEILAGGHPVATALLDAVARQEVVEQQLTVRTGDISRQLHVTALASRARDGLLGGALLILRRLE